MRQTIFHPYVTLAANEHIVKDYRKNYIKSINVPKTIHEHNLRNPQNFAKINPNVFETRDIFCTERPMKSRPMCYSPNKNISVNSTNDTIINQVKVSFPKPRTPFIRNTPEGKNRKKNIFSNTAKEPYTFQKNQMNESSTSDSERTVKCEANSTEETVDLEGSKLTQYIQKTIRQKNDPKIDKAVKTEFERQDPQGMVKFTANELETRSKELRQVKNKLEKITNMFGPRARSLQVNSNDLTCPPVDVSKKNSFGKVIISESKKTLDKMKENLYGKYIFELNRQSKEHKPKVRERRADPDFTVEMLADGKYKLNWTETGHKSQRLHIERYGKGHKSHMELAADALDFVNKAKDLPLYKAAMKSIPAITKEDKKEMVLRNKIEKFNTVMPQKLIEAKEILKMVDVEAYPENERDAKFYRHNKKIENLRVRYKNGDAKIRRSMLRPQ